MLTISSPQTSSLSTPRKGKMPSGGVASSVASRASSRGSMSTTPLSGRFAPAYMRKDGAVVVAGAFYVGPAVSVDLNRFISVFSPLAEKTPTAHKMRERSFAEADGNGSGMCSLAEIEAFILRSLMNKYKEDGQTLFDAFRPSYIRAFSIAKAIKPTDGSSAEVSGDDFVTFVEFRLLVAYLCVYAAMFDAFSVIDNGLGGENDDGDKQFELTAWLDNYFEVREHGFCSLANISDDKIAETAFKKMDKNNGGVVNLTEFCDFLRQAELEAKSPLGKLLNPRKSKSSIPFTPPKIKSKALASSPITGGPAATPTRVSLANTETKSKAVAGAYKTGSTASSDLRRFIDTFQPYTMASLESSKLRESAFRLVDSNGNGYCSLAEIELFVSKVLEKENTESGSELFHAFYPSYVRAFSAAKAVKPDHDSIIKGTKNATGADFVTFPEFRLFCAYLCVFAAMFDAFAKIDGRGLGRDENDDRRLESSEWIDGYEKVQDHGFVGLKNISSEELAKKHFTKMDKTGGGIVLLDEWCEYLKQAEIDGKTALGRLLNPTHNTVAPAQGKKTKIPRALKEPPSNFIARKTVAGAFRMGNSVSIELSKFVDAFQPYAEIAPKALKLREQAFRGADSNGTGFVSLAEFETFVAKTLTNSQKMDGKRLFDGFRPSYILAFNTAKTIQSGDGSVIEGTKSASADDYVTFAEFRLLCAYLCIFAAMFDAFSKIDGKGLGITEDDDRRIQLDEWTEGYEEVREHGFIVLKNVDSEAKAQEVFGKMDVNGGGFVLMNEWCEFLKKEEIGSKTSVGKLLSPKREKIRTAQSPSKLSSPPPSAKRSGVAGVLSEKKIAPPKPIIVAGAYTVGEGVSSELRRFVLAFQPLSEASPEALKLRERGFSTADGNGTGKCSLAEIESFVLKTLLNMHRKDGKELFNMFRPSYIRAFNCALLIRGGENQEGESSGFIGFAEFRLLNAYLCIFASMFDAFVTVDGDNVGRTEDDDMRIGLKEWVGGYDSVKKHGFVALEEIGSEEDAKGKFSAMNKDGGEYVLLEEWCAYLKEAENNAHTSIGEILYPRQGIKSSISNGEESSTTDITTSEAEKAQSEDPTPSQPTIEPATEQSVDVETEAHPEVKSANSLALGNNLSDDCESFVSVFKPYAEKTAEGDEEREKGFVKADQGNRNLCDLADIESFVKNSLLVSHQKRGLQLFDSYRPSISRAFLAAKNLRLDREKVEGDFVSLAEFRLFNAYLCMYAAMVDAFSQIRDSGEVETQIDSFFQKAQWLDNYDKVHDYGFIALDRVASKEDAETTFPVLDVKGEEQISFSDWCDFLENAEVDGNTELGSLLLGE